MDIPVVLVEEAPSLYPENALLDEARDCADNYGECSIEELENLSHRTYNGAQTIDSLYNLAHLPLLHPPPRVKRPRKLFNRV